MNVQVQCLFVTVKSTEVVNNAWKNIKSIKNTILFFLCKNKHTEISKYPIPESSLEIIYYLLPCSR